MPACLVMSVLFSLLAAAATAQPVNRCASCHFANLGSVPRPEGLGDWWHSAHAKHGVGCDRCHGGDPTTYLPTEAHRDVMSPSNPASPVNAANLGRTCGACHEPAAQAFARSAHQSRAAADAGRGPTCLTCHGAMRAEVLSPAAVESRCATCHPPGSPRADYAAALRATVESVNIERRRADEVEEKIARLPDRVTRLALGATLADVRAVLNDAVARLHAFELPAADERVGAARRSLDAVSARVKAASTSR